MDTVTTHTTVVETPAGVFLTRPDCERLHTALVHSNDPDVRELRKRIERYLRSDWEERAAARG